MSDETTTAAVSGDQPETAPVIDTATAAAPPQTESQPAASEMTVQSAETVSVSTETQAAAAEPLLANAIDQIVAAMPAATVDTEVGAAADTAEPATTPPTSPPVASEPVPTPSTPERATAEQTVTVAAEATPEPTGPLTELKTETAEVREASQTADQSENVQTVPDVLSQVSGADAVPLDISQVAEALPANPEPAEPDPVADLKANLAAEQRWTARLREANDVLRSQLVLATQSLDQCRAEFDQVAAAVRGEVVQLADTLHEAVFQFQQKAEAAASPPRTDRVRVFLRKAAIVAGECREIGATLGHIALAPGVTLNFLVDAIRDGIAKGR